MSSINRNPLPSGMGRFNENLEKLIKLTPELAFPPVIDNGGEYKQYQMDEGECFGKYIHRSGNDIAIHRWYNSAGSKFPVHIHVEKEWVIVYKGSMELIVGDKTYILKKGDSRYILPNQPHSSSYPEECKYVTITIPPAKEFPYGN